METRIGRCYPYVIIVYNNTVANFLVSEYDDIKNQFRCAAFITSINGYSEVCP